MVQGIGRWISRSEAAHSTPAGWVELGRFRREAGDLEGAIQMFRQALERDPGNLWASANPGLVPRFAGRCSPRWR